MRARPDSGAGPAPMPVEYPTTLYLNGRELLTLQTTPVDLGDWAMGFLFTEGLSRGPHDLVSLVVDEERGLVWADLAPGAPGLDPDSSGRRYLTSGCGRGVTFSSVRDALSLSPVLSERTVSRAELAGWMQAMGRQTPLYDASGGMHAAAVVRPDGGLLVREDIGRHNAVDKAIGAALQAGWSAADLVICTSGRISYEMCTKVARFGVAIAASRTAATDQAVRLARRLQIELVGYVRSAERLTVYTDGRRLAAPVA